MKENKVFKYRDFVEVFSKSHNLEDEIRKRLGAIGYEF